MPAPRQRRMTVLSSTLEAFAKTKVGGFYFVHIGNKIDPPLIKLTKGRFSFAGTTQVLLLIHTGAKSGARRETPLVYCVDGDKLILVASNAGSTKHPAWYHNLRANPQCEVVVKKASGPRVAREVTDPAERDRVWAIVNDYYAGYETYQGRTDGRLIPLMVLEKP